MCCTVFPEYFYSGYESQIQHIKQLENCFEMVKVAKMGFKELNEARISNTVGKKNGKVLLLTMICARHRTMTFEDLLLAIA